MENIQTSSTRAVWLMVGIVLVALNLRPSMAAVGPLLSAIRGEVPLSFSSASLLTMLPVMAMGVAMFLGMRIALRIGEHRTVVLSLLIIGIATASRLYLDSAAGLVTSAVVAGLGIALIQAVMPALIKARFADSVSLLMGLYVTSIMGGAALAASFSPFVLTQTGSWRIGLAIWALLALVALGCWCVQRWSVTPLPEAASRRHQAFSGNARAWLLAIFLAWAPPPIPAYWPGWHRITWKKAGANSTPACCWDFSRRWRCCPASSLRRSPTAGRTNVKS